MSNDKNQGNVYFPKERPICCGKQMYAAGGVLGTRPDGTNGDVEHFWRCEICGQECHDVLPSDPTIPVTE